MKNFLGRYAKMFKKIVISIIALTFAIATIGCGKADKFLPNKALEHYFEAQKSRNWVKVYDLLSEEFKAQLGERVSSPEGDQELKALKEKNPDLKLDTTRDKVIAFLDAQDKSTGEFIAYEIIEVPQVEEDKAEIIATVSVTRKVTGKEEKKIQEITLKLEKDGWKIMGGKKQ